MPALFFVDFQMVSGNKNKFNSQRESKKREDSGLAPSKTLLKTFQERAAELAGPALAPLGLELVFVQCLIEGGRPVLRLFIDRLSDAASVLDTTALASGVSLDDCAEASRAVDAILEADDQAQPDGYVLEVSSPGLNRPLLKESDYRRFVGRLAKIKLRREGKASVIKGCLATMEDGSLALKVEGELIPFAFDEVISARLSLDDIDFTPKSR